MLKKNIPTSSVCSEDYFYDQDGKIENALAKMETMWSKALKNAIDDSCTIDDIESIREFVIYQISRTKAMLSHNREMATSMMKTLTLSMTGLYDAEIIRKGNQFVEEVDKERKYLTKRRYITKSKFDVYFSIRTAAEQFVERQNILKRVPWEQYSQIQEEFQKLKDFGIPGTIGDGDLWLFWCPWWHFIKNRLIMIIYIKRITV